MNRDQVLAREVLDATECHGTVTRDGEYEACGKPPVAIIDARDLEDGCYWPACAWHANRYGTHTHTDEYGDTTQARVVPLREIVRALT